MHYFNDLIHHRRLFALAIPMIFSNITVPLLGLVDTAVIGHLEYAYYLGGSSVGAMIITFIVWLCGFLRMSTTGLAAQAFGASDMMQNIAVLIRGILVASVIGLVLIIFKGVYLDVALSLAQGTEQVQLYARQYGEIRMWGLPAALSNLVILGWLLGNHQAKAVMWILILTNMVNLVLDLVFVFGLGWQVQGVAAATLVAEYVGIMAGLVVIWKNYRVTIMRYMEHILPNIVQSQALLAYFKLNRDILIRTLCLEICFVFITFQSARLGDNVVAANAILMNFVLLISFGLDGIANAVEAMVGKAKGAKDQQTLNGVVNIALFWTLIFAISYSLVFILAGKNLVTLMSDIPSVVSVANDHLFWLMLLPVIACWCYLFDGIYVGLMLANVMRNSMIIATFGSFFPIWFVFRSYDNHALWGAFVSFMLVRGLTLAWHYRRKIMGHYD